MNGDISEFLKQSLLTLSGTVIEGIAAKYEQVKKGVNSIMGGKILDYEAKTILQTGILQGKLEGKLALCIELIEDGLLTISEAAKRLNVTEDTVINYLNEHNETNN